MLVIFCPKISSFFLNQKHSPLAIKILSTILLLGYHNNNESKKACKNLCAVSTSLHKEISFLSFLPVCALHFHRAAERDFSALDYWDYLSLHSYWVKIMLIQALVLCMLKVTHSKAWHESVCTDITTLHVAVNYLNSSFSREISHKSSLSKTVNSLNSCISRRA